MLPTSRSQCYQLVVSVFNSYIQPFPVCSYISHEKISGCYPVPFLHKNMTRNTKYLQNTENIRNLQRMLVIFCIYLVTFLCNDGTEKYRDIFPRVCLTRLI